MCVSRGGGGCTKLQFKNGRLIPLSPWTALSGEEFDNHMDNNEYMFLSGIQAFQAYFEI